MMHKPIPLIVLTLALLPTVAAAYVTPEELLIEGTLSTRFYDPPPSTRETEDIVAEQNASASAVRASAQASIWGNGLPSSSSSAMSETVHSAAPESALDALLQMILNQQQGNAQSSSSSSLTVQQRIDERILDRIHEQQEQAELQALYEQYGILTGDATLHSGAPLSDTGPATAIALIAIAAAVTFTIVRAMWMEKEAD